MRQCGNVNGHAQRGEFAVDVVAPAPGPLKPAPEALPEPLLVTNALHGGGKFAVTHVVGPQRQYARLLGTQVVAFAGGKDAQSRLQCLAALVDAPIALAPGQLGRHLEALVDDRKIAIVMQHALVGRILRENSNPEVDIGL